MYLLQLVVKCANKVFVLVELDYCVYWNLSRVGTK